MIICHESNVFKQATTRNHNTCYCYSQVSRTNICVTRPRMSHRTKSVKRPRSDTSRTRPGGSQHQDAAGRQGARHLPQAQRQPHGPHQELSKANNPSKRPGTTPRPHINPNFQHKPGDLTRVAQETSEERYRDKVCTYCTTVRKEVRHHHFSTEKLREFAHCWTKGPYMCPMCQEQEPTTLPETITKRVILADSTIYGVWDQPKLPKILSEHIDIECIVGARVSDLTRAMMKILLDHPNRLEIVVIAGINNIAKNDHPDIIIHEFKELKEIVQEHSEQHGHVPPSTVSISTLILPPKYCSFNVPDDPLLAEWKPGPGFRDRYEEIKKVNLAIKALNEEDKLSWLNLHMQGVKILKSGPQHKYDTKPGAVRVWRESEVAKKLHFTMENKLKIMQYLQKTFQRNAKRDPPL